MRFISFIICISTILLLAGCGEKEDLGGNAEPLVSVADSNSSHDASISVSEDSFVESSEDASQNDESSEDEIPKEDVFPLISNHGKTVAVYGDLANSQFDEAVADLTTVLGGYDKNVAFVAYSLDGSKAVSYNTQENIFPASMIKAAYALYCCLQMEQGNGSLQTEMAYQDKHYEIGTGDMQYAPVGTIFDMATIIEKTMTISDNVGYLMMVDYFGRDGYNQWITELGAPSLQIKPTVWCLSSNANEWALVWRELYNYFKSDSEYAGFLYNCCTNTAGNFATAGLEGVTYSHKQGHQRSGDWHSYSDAGIVWKGDASYLFVILTDAPGPSNYEAEFFKDIMSIVDSKLFS